MKTLDYRVDFFAEQPDSKATYRSRTFMTKPRDTLGVFGQKMTKKTTECQTITFSQSSNELVTSRLIFQLPVKALIFGYKLIVDDHERKP